MGGKAMATVSRINLRPLEADLDCWEPADPGYLAALLPTSVAFEIEAILLGPVTELDEPVEAVAWMNDPHGLSLVAPQPLHWTWLAGTLGATWRRRLFLPVRTRFSELGIYTIAVHLKGADPVERGFRVRMSS
jgi:hypothetical protein